VTASTYAGLVLALLSTSAYNAGLIVEKQALGRLPAISSGRIVALAVTLLSSPRWLCGFALMVLGLGLQIVALALAPVTLVQPLITAGVAVILVLSRLVLREQLGRAEYLCVVVMAVSVILLVASADGASAEVGHHVSGMLLAAVAVPSCLAGLLAAAGALRAGTRKHRAPAAGVSYGFATGTLYGVAALAIKALSGVVLHRHGAGGIVMALLSSPYLYVMGGCLASGMVLFQIALQRCRISIVAPVSSVLGSIYFIVFGTWIFHERLPSDPWELALRLGGIVVTCFGVVQLSRQASPLQPAARQLPAAAAAGGPRVWRNEGEAHGSG
jgi:drug/metabolite transporter (DMT)-like permease